ncbi:unnamed protein product [Parnassius apollo]|uniref:(apollo) hypothetical protein n=1 Tax=Parnassius apollo TaxID=110799 RepID=A0A8S3X0L3_PARAO|nr:unnamed protein product [Parnassius apollo]
MTEPRNGAGLGRLPLFGAHKMDDGTNERTRIGPRLGARELALDAASCGPPAVREELYDHPAALRIHHPHQKAWCRLGFLELNKRHPPLVEHVACVGQNL